MKRAYVDSCIWITRFEGKSAYKHVIEEHLMRLALETMRQLKNYAGVFADALRIAQIENLKAMDAIHVALAQHHQCELFVSSDPHFRSLKTIRPHWIDLSGSAPPVAASA